MATDSVYLKKTALGKLEGVEAYVPHDQHPKGWCTACLLCHDGPTNRPPEAVAPAQWRDKGETLYSANESAAYLPQPEHWGASNDIPDSTAPSYADPLTRWPLSYLNGGGGSGKTTRAIELFRGRKPLVLTPTHRLAKEMRSRGVDAQTYHSFFRFCGVRRARAVPEDLATVQSKRATVMAKLVEAKVKAEHRAGLLEGGLRVPLRVTSMDGEEVLWEDYGSDIHLYNKRTGDPCVTLWSSEPSYPGGRLASYEDAGAGVHGLSGTGASQRLRPRLADRGASSPAVTGSPAIAGSPMTGSRSAATTMKRSRSTTGASARTSRPSRRPSASSPTRSSAARCGKPYPGAGAGATWSRSGTRGTSSLPRGRSPRQGPTALFEHHKKAYPDEPVPLLYRPRDSRRQNVLVTIPGPDAVKEELVLNDTVEVSVETAREVLEGKWGPDWALGYALTVHSSQGLTIEDPQKVWIVDDYLQWSNLSYLAVSRVRYLHQLARCCPPPDADGPPPPAYDEATARKNVGLKLAAYRRVDAARRHKCNLRMKDILELKEQQGNRCAACNIELLWCYEPKDSRQFSVDRVDNTRGHTGDNIRLTCLECNRKRGAAALTE